MMRFAPMALMALAACDKAPQTTQLKSVAHVTQPVSVASKQPGESCATEGVSVCSAPDGTHAPLCVHYGPGLDSSGNDPWYVCSSTCDATKDCREGFECVQLMAGEGNRACMPHADFAPHVAAARPAESPPTTEFVDPMPISVNADPGAPMPAAAGGVR